ncbi:MAG: DNA-directed RNA polymerase subunit A', partial [Methanomassiliicoccaceae archaeon]|nr:DNA-directed RNA polymerase subunit A' [Methanomassiliicoccaceae archaeon]
DLKLTADGTVRNTVGTVIQFKYGEDGVDPSRTVRGKAIDLDDLFAEVLGDDADTLLKIDDLDIGEDYGSREKDEMEYSEEEDGEEYDDAGEDFEGGSE